MLKNVCKYSYGAFIRNNPKASRDERKAVVKRFLDFTRGDIKEIEKKKIISNR